MNHFGTAWPPQEWRLLDRVMADGKNQVGPVHERAKKIKKYRDILKTLSHIEAKYYRKHGNH
jgi:hypothetical protein